MAGRHKSDKAPDDVHVADDRRTGQERRKTVRRINEYVLTPEVLEFINAVNEFKTVNQKPFPTWSEIYAIFLSLGYRKVEE